jgi:hypothetical protein
MRRKWLALSIVIALAGFVGIGRGYLQTSAQDATPTTAEHPIVGTWIVDTVVATDTDSPEVGIFIADGSLVGLGANRVAGGHWEVIDSTSVMLTLVTVFDAAGEGGYVVVRGPHVVDATGETWTCECTFTVVGADGTVLDSGLAPASAHRLHTEGPEAVGTPLAEVPTWTPAMPETATPAT